MSMPPTRACFRRLSNSKLLRVYARAMSRMRWRVLDNVMCEMDRRGL